MDRYNRVICKQHELYGMFMGCLRDAVFHLHQPDVEAIKCLRLGEGMSEKEVEKLPKYYFTVKGRCRRSVPPRLELAVRVQSVLELFEGLTDNDGVVLITSQVWKAHKRGMEHIWANCLSDPLGMAMYYDQGKIEHYARTHNARDVYAYACAYTRVHSSTNNPSA